MVETVGVEPTQNKRVGYSHLGSPMPSISIIWWKGRDSNPHIQGKRIYSPPQFTVSAVPPCFGTQSR